MQFSKLQDTLKIVDLTPNGVEDGMVERRHGNLFPSSIRCIISGPSMCGKTNIMLNLIYDPNGLRFENIYIYSNSLNQPHYQQLVEILEKIPEIGYFPSENTGEYLQPNDAKPNSIIIFDDCITDEQNVIKAYFSRGRHNKIDSFYLTQCYTKVPKHLIRDNANFLIIFPQDDINLKHIYDEHVSGDMNFKEFQLMCRQIWGEGKYSVVVINKNETMDSGRYRKGFDTIVKL